MVQRSAGRPLGGLAVFALGVAAAVWVASGDAEFPLVPVLVGLGFGCFVLVLNSPVWAAATLLIPELSIFNYSIESIGLTLRLALVAVGAALTFRALLPDARLGDHRLRRVVLPAAAFVVVATIVHVLQADSDYMSKYLRYQLSELMTLVMVACLIRSRLDLVKFASVGLTLGLFSAVAAIWQHVDRESAFYGQTNVEWIYDWKSRAIGLSDNPVALANCMMCVLVPVMGLFVSDAVRRGRLRNLLLASLAIVGAAMYLTYTRSTLMASGAGLAGMALFLRGRRRTILLGAMVALVVAYQAALSLHLLNNRYSKNATNDRSASSHEALLTVGLAVAMDNAVIGIGHRRFEEISTQYADVLQGASGASGGIAVGNERPHNDFLSIVISWGVGAFVAYLLIIIGALRNYWLAARNPDRLIHGVAVGGAGGLIAYAVNSAFHNSLDSSSALWLFAGLSVALARLPASGGSGRHVLRLVRRPIHRLVRRPIASRHRHGRKNSWRYA